jgi:LuxR family maltose regulon positive regulatory protein
VARALDIARPEWYVRTFLDEGDLIAGILGELANRYKDPYLSRLVEHIQPGEPSTASLADGATLEPLTMKEREVLSRLTSYLSLQEIASEMYVSLNTVKTHVRSIYRKLGVSTRTAAVTAARGYGLL